MDRLQDTVLLSIDPSNALPGRRTPRQKNHTTGPDSGHGVEGLLSEPFPSFPRVAIRLMSANGQAGIEHQNTAFRPRRQEPTFVWW